MSEIEKLNNYLAKPSPATKRPFSEPTKKAYLSTYNKLTALLDSNTIYIHSQKKILHVINNQNQSISTQNSLLNIAIIIRTIYELNTTELANKRELNKIPLAAHIASTNESLNLPSYEDLENYLEILYQKNDYIAYIINYLLINYGVRNQDVNFDIVLLKRDATDTDINYLWLSKTGKAVWIRRDYKTVGIYGIQTTTIKDPKFIKMLKKCKNKTLIPHDNNIGLYVKRLTLNEIGEGNYFKILVDYFKTNLKKLKELSQSRGTSLETIINNYDINK